MEFYPAMHARAQGDDIQRVHTHHNKNLITFLLYALELECDFIIKEKDREVKIFIVLF